MTWRVETLCDRIVPGAELRIFEEGANQQKLFPVRIKLPLQFQAPRGAEESVTATEADETISVIRLSNGSEWELVRTEPKQLRGPQLVENSVPATYWTVQGTK